MIETGSAMDPGSAAQHSCCAASGARAPRLPPAAERIAGLHRAVLIAGHEPLLSLRRRAVREGTRHPPPRRLPLQRVVADRGRHRQRGIDVTRLEETRTLLVL